MNGTWALLASINNIFYNAGQWMGEHPVATALIIGGFAIAFGVFGALVFGPSIGMGFWAGLAIGAGFGGVLGVAACATIGNLGLGGSVGPGSQSGTGSSQTITLIVVQPASQGAVRVTIYRSGPDRRPQQETWTAENLDSRIMEMKEKHLAAGGPSIPVRWDGVPLPLRQTIIEAFHSAGLVVSDHPGTPTTPAQSAP